MIQIMINIISTLIFNKQLLYHYDIIFNIVVMLYIKNTVNPYVKLIKLLQ